MSSRFCRLIRVCRLILKGKRSTLAQQIISEKNRPILLILFIGAGVTWQKYENLNLYFKYYSFATSK